MLLISFRFLNSLINLHKERNCLFEIIIIKNNPIFVFIEYQSSSRLY